jgi:hypothetical protein
VFIILYNHHLPNISELENQVPKLRFKILLIIGQSTAEMVKVLQYYIVLRRKRTPINLSTIDHGVFAHQHPFCANLCDLNKSALLVDKKCIYLDRNKRNKYSANLVHT